MYQIQQNRIKVFSMRCRKIMRVLIENNKSLCDQSMLTAFSNPHLNPNPVSGKSLNLF